eukprot:3629976-Rhodomonas_salina.2
MGTLQVIAMQQAYEFKSTIQAPEPKNQTEARTRTDAQDWKDSEWVEMDTIYQMGTIVYVKNCDLLKGTMTILTKFTYKCKMGDKGQVIKKKGRLVISGDLQNETEYTETFAPTSRFN